MKRLALPLSCLLLLACGSPAPRAPEPVTYAWPGQTPRTGQPLPGPAGPDALTYARRHQALPIHATPSEVSAVVQESSIAQVVTESAGVGRWQLARGPQPAPMGARWTWLNFRGGTLVQARSWSGGLWPTYAWPIDSWSEPRPGGFVSSSVAQREKSKLEQQQEAVEDPITWPPNQQSEADKEAQGTGPTADEQPDWWLDYVPGGSLQKK